MNVREQLEKRLAEAVKTYAKVPILIGPKWLREISSNGKVKYEYTGGPKVAKALARNQQRVLSGILTSLDLSGLRLKVKLNKDGVIEFLPKPGSSGQAATAP